MIKLKFRGREYERKQGESWPQDGSLDAKLLVLVSNDCERKVESQDPEKESTLASLLKNELGDECSIIQVTNEFSVEAIEGAVH